jgi:hypothetical protein
MASTLSPTRKTLNLCRECEHSRLAAQALVAAYELLTPLLRRALPTRQPTQHSRSAKQRQRQAGGQQA